MRKFKLVDYLMNPKNWWLPLLVILLLTNTLSVVLEPVVPEPVVPEPVVPVPVVRSAASGGPDAGPGLAEHFEHRLRPLSAGVAVAVPFVHATAVLALGWTFLGPLFSSLRIAPWATMSAPRVDATSPPTSTLAPRERSLTGRANLEFFGALAGLSPGDASDRAVAVLEMDRIGAGVTGWSTASGCATAWPSGTGTAT